MRIVPFEPRHIFELDIDTRHNEDARELLREHPEALEKLTKAAWSMADGEEIVACGGHVEHVPAGTAWWIAMSAKALKRPVELTRLVRHQIESHAPLGDNYAHAVDEAAGRWLETLGFQHVGYENNYALYLRSF